jgi:hypothetical protein
MAKVTREQAEQFIQTPYLYVGVTALEALNCPVQKWVTEIEGVTVLGTLEPVASLESKLLLPE